MKTIFVVALEIIGSWIRFGDPTRTQKNTYNTYFWMNAKIYW